MRNRVVALAAGIATFVSLTFAGTASAASASQASFTGWHALDSGVVQYSGEIGATGVPDCPEAFVCLYDLTYYNGAAIGFSHSRVSCDYVNLAAYGWHNRAESIHNNTALTIRVLKWTGLSWYTIGTAQPRKAYPSFGANNNTADRIQHPC